MSIGNQKVLDELWADWYSKLCQQNSSRTRDPVEFALSQAILHVAALRQVQTGEKLVQWNQQKRWRIELSTNEIAQDAAQRRKVKATHQFQSAHPRIPDCLRTIRFDSEDRIIEEWRKKDRERSSDSVATILPPTARLSVLSKANTNHAMIKWVLLPLCQNPQLQKELDAYLRSNGSNKNVSPQALRDFLGTSEEPSLENNLKVTVAEKLFSPTGEKFQDVQTTIRETERKGEEREKWAARQWAATALSHTNSKTTIQLGSPGDLNDMLKGHDLTVFTECPAGPFESFIQVKPVRRVIVTPQSKDVWFSVHGTGKHYSGVTHLAFVLEDQRQATQSIFFTSSHEAKKEQSQQGYLYKIDGHSPSLTISAREWVRSLPDALRPKIQVTDLPPTSGIPRPHNPTSSAPTGPILDSTWEAFSGPL